MCGSQRKRKPATPGRGDGLSKNDVLERLDDAISSAPPPILQDLRAIYWRITAAGHRLPAEAGVILIDGGRR